MKRTIVAAILAAFASACGGVQGPVQEPAPVTPAVDASDFPSVAEVRDQTVVLVMKDRMDRFRMFCAGIWIKEKWILTAHHCVEGTLTKMDENGEPEEEQEFVGRTMHYRTYSDYVRDYESPMSSRARTATVMRLEPATDLALLLVDGTAPPHKTAELRTNPMMDGSDVFVVGHSVGMHFSLSRGIVSASRRANDLTLLQLSVAAAPGNSGGPVYDADGKLVGVVSFGNMRAALMTFATHRDSIVDFLALDVLKTSNGN